MKKFIALLLLLVFSGYASAQPASRFTLVDNITTAGSITVIPSFTAAGYSYLNINAITLVITQGDTASSFQLVSGTGTNCGTNRVALTNVYAGTPDAVDYFTPKYSPARIVPLGQNVCLVLSNAPTKASIEMDYSISQ